MKLIKRMPALLLALLFAVLPVFRRIKAEPAVTLTIRFVSGETALSGALFDIYYVAAFNPAFGYDLVPEFANDFVIEGYNDHFGWDALAEHMRIFAEENGIAPTESGYTDSIGRVSFPAGGNAPLEQGLYLVAGHSVESNGSVYTCLPFLVLLPSWDAENSVWIYSVVASPKSGSVTPTPEPTPETTPSPTPVPQPTETPLPTSGTTPTPAPEPYPSPVPPETPEPTSPPSPPTCTASAALAGAAVIAAALAIIRLRRK